MIKKKTIVRIVASLGVIALVLGAILPGLMA